MEDLLITIYDGGELSVGSIGVPPSRGLTEPTRRRMMQEIADKEGPGWKADRYVLVTARDGDPVVIDDWWRE